MPGMSFDYTDYTMAAIAGRPASLLGTGTTASGEFQMN
jgi:hypothetical protein